MSDGSPDRDTVDAAHEAADTWEAMEALEAAVTWLAWHEQRQAALLLERFGLTLAQYLVLIQVARREPGCAMGTLAAELAQSGATTTGIIDRLVRRGLAQRRRDPADRRLVLVTLTEPGRRVLAAARAARQARARELLADLRPEDRARLLGLLERYRTAGGGR
jgi:DNA-binding MarR family transcriptional regulator